MQFYFQTRVLNREIVCVRIVQRNIMAFVSMNLQIAAMSAVFLKWCLLQKLTCCAYHQLTHTLREIWIFVLGRCTTAAVPQ